MSTLNVKIPDEMEDDIESFLERNPHYLNKSELVRDALRHVLATKEADVGPVFGADDPLLSAPTVSVDDPVVEDQIDDVEHVVAFDDDFRTLGLTLVPEDAGDATA